MTTSTSGPLRPHDFKEPALVYETAWCGFCQLAKQLLERRGIPFATVDVTQDPATRAWLEEESGQRTMPQIFIGGTSIGGYTDLARLDADGELARLVGAAGSSG